MPIISNGGKIKQVSYGTTPISKVYYGASLVWQRLSKAKVDVLRGYAAYKGGQSWDRGQAAVVGELGKTWTVMGPVGAGESFTVGGVTVTNVAGKISVQVVSNRGTMSYSAPGTHTGTPLVSVSATTDWYGYRTRLYVNGVSQETSSNGGAFKAAESTVGGNVRVNCRWVAQITGSAVGNPTSDSDVSEITYAIQWGAVLAEYVARVRTTARTKIDLPALEGYRWAVAYRGYGGDASKTSKTGGAAGPTGVRLYAPRESLTVNWYSAFTTDDRLIGDYTVGFGSNGAATTWLGENSPPIDLPWGDTLPGETASTSTGKYSGYGAGGSYFAPDSEGNLPAGSEGGRAEISCYLWT